MLTKSCSNLFGLLSCLFPYRFLERFSSKQYFRNMVMANTSTHSEDVCHITASAQDVGREFVRQYYTLLNRAPSFLHRSVVCIAMISSIHITGQ